LNSANSLNTSSSKFKPKILKTMLGYLITINGMLTKPYIAEVINVCQQNNNLLN